MKAMDPFDISFSGINLVEASAGTGKTYNITSLYIRALIELDMSVGNILVVTYTEAATKELKDRLLTRIRESVQVLKSGDLGKKQDDFLADLLENVNDREQAISRLKKAVRSFDEAAVYTIHGFCYHALQEQAFESGAMYDAEMIGDDHELVLEAVDDYWRNWVAEASEDPLKRPLLQFLLDNNYNPDELAKELGGQLGQPFLEIHPKETNGAAHFNGELETLSKLYHDMRNCWKADQEKIISLLYDDGLNGNKYRSSSIPGWAEQMGDFLSSEVPHIELFDYFHKFTTSTLKDSLNKGQKHPPQHPFFDLADEYQQVAESLQHFGVGFKKRLLLYLRDELRQKKEELQVLSYDDLLLRLQEALQDESQGTKLADNLRTKYPLALVDEFQDTDPSQYDIFRRIYTPDTENSALFMIGDPKQSIYSFRGADVFSYLKAKGNAPEDQVYGLKRNFRSTPKLISGINKLFGDHQNPFIIDDISFDAVKPGKKQSEYALFKEKGKRQAPIRFRNLTLDETKKLNKGTAEERAAEDTASEIQRLITSGKKGEAEIGSDPVKAKDIAVLVRYHRQANLIRKSLQKRGIKSVQYSQESVFESEEAGQLEIFLKAVAEPANESFIKTALSLPITEFQAHHLLDIEEDEERWMSILEQFSEWHRLWQLRGFSAMFRAVLRDASIAEHLMKFNDGERRLTNLLHLGELMQEEAQQHKEGTRGLLKWLAHKREEENGQQDEEQLRLESDEELVKIVTMHRSKGLEYPIVFCPFLWHGPELSDKGQPLVYHDPDDLDKTYLDLSGKMDSDRDRKRWLVAREELAESLRLAYVALTRAEQCCYLTWAYASKSEFSPLGYLFQDAEKVFSLMKETISKSYKAIGSGTFDKRMQQLCQDHPQLFAIQADPKPAGSQQLDLLSMNGAPSLTHRTFDRPVPIESSYQVSSFSSLTSWMEEDPDMPDYDQFTEIAEPVPSDIEEQELTIFNFPRGPQPGTCIHTMFEEIDFGDLSDIDQLINTELVRYGIDDKWNKVMWNMLKTVTSAKIHPQNNELCMASLKADDIIPEMEFYFQSGAIKTKRLQSIIRDGDSKLSHPGQAASGFLKGYIDLTFQFDGKFYLLDYKSNHLGDTIKDYDQHLLQEEMEEASYDLQYHIYTIALHRFLKNRLPGYSYEQHFGGAFYLFVRGMNSDGREGIFFDRPDYATIQQLDEYIRTGGQHE